MSDTQRDGTDAEGASLTSEEGYEPRDVFGTTTEMDLRSGADNCTKVGTCDAECPVAEVNDDFPGPQFQGPEQWRLSSKGDVEIDDSITECSNCLQCDSGCPSGVPFSEMHNTARAKYVLEEQSLSIKKIRNRILANYRTSAWLASKLPRTANFFMNNGAVRWVMEKTMKIPSEREFPEFATQTFREWWRERGGAQVQSEEKRVAYFHGCYSNYNTTEVAKAMVRVYESLGYEIVVPKQKCSGTPMFANGRVDDARRHAKVNVEHLGDAIEAGYDVIATCSSCSLALRQEYPDLFDLDGIDELAAHTYDAMEYLRVHEDLESELAGAQAEDFPDVAYHAPCHSRNQGLGRQAVELFEDVEGVTVTDVGDSCSGISGTYGWKEEKYETSMEIGEEMFEHMEDADAEHGMTECPTCSMQMEHGTGYEISHPMQLLERVLT
ncbi:Glycerol-3-phosphate dehydrogenase chain C protein [Halorhabdus tiamatea SARL4B]|uniref:Anaerobic glycerol-3-phosphate dehydrogenase subunit C n=1 Tax=Halorhabdus tiamatea SARL4B TaxID=1033806 RepID=F7PNR7_9EURY|nr:anaerobic glycerol-3-phosphate dehydrogenase subunit C [Halorhabdus tiamatea]ERJ06774.1 Glycerol-3-phosphate dehydrogenase chain C protein [Halorhabdus tiamatea SARL4B]CCQ33697.1 anaerobic glycerol-3-phosphate dehydrogenase subunit C [Halorhabdus tiamatea SARL4B]